MADFMGVDEAAAYLGIQPMKLRRLLRSGVVKSEMRVGLAYILSRQEVKRLKKLGLGQDLRRKGTPALKSIRKRGK